MAGTSDNEHVLVALDAALTSVLEDLGQRGHDLLKQGADPAKAQAGLDDLFTQAQATLDKLAAGKALAGEQAIVEADARAHPWLRSLGVRHPEQAVNVKALDHQPNPLVQAWEQMQKGLSTSWARQVFPPLASAASQASYKAANGYSPEAFIARERVDTKQPDDVAAPGPAFGGATNMADAVTYELAADRADRIEDLVDMYQAVMANIVASPAVPDKGAAIAAAADELQQLLAAKKAIGDSMGSAGGPASLFGWLSALRDAQARGDRTDLVRTPASWLATVPKSDKPAPWTAPKLKPNGSPASGVLARVVNNQPKELKRIQPIQWGTPEMQAEYKDKLAPAPVDAAGRIQWGLNPQTKAAPAFDPDAPNPNDGLAQEYARFLSRERKRTNRPLSWL